MSNLAIANISETDSTILSRLLVSDSLQYRQHFVPFPTDHASLSTRLRLSRRDSYWGIWTDEVLAGFFMLRGFDEGYELPSFGVYVAHDYCGRGLASLALSYSEAWCRLNGIRGMILKVHADNRVARTVYERAGFVNTGRCADTGQDTMGKTWSIG